MLESTNLNIKFSHGNVSRSEEALEEFILVTTRLWNRPGIDSLFIEAKLESIIMGFEKRLRSCFIDIASYD